MRDPIVEEFRQVGNAYAESFGHDLEAMVEDLRRRQAEHPERIVSFAKPEPGIRKTGLPNDLFLRASGANPINWVREAVV